MQIILTKDVEHLGATNEVVRVKDGYARNYLLPKNLAIPATPGNLRSRSEKIQAAQDARKARVSEAQGVAEQLNGRTFIVLAKAGKEGKLFGSITSTDVVGAIFHFAGIEIDKRKINLLAPIKETGNYQINIKLTQGVTASVRIDVRPDVHDVPEEEVVEEAPVEHAEAPAEEPQAEADAAADAV